MRRTLTDISLIYSVSYKRMFIAGRVMPQAARHIQCLLRLLVITLCHGRSAIVWEQSSGCLELFQAFVHPRRVI